jgi:hypothetical protein
MSYRELATNARVSKAAISKIKDRLQSICDVKTLAYRRKLVLRTDAKTFMRILVAFFMASKPGPFLRTPFVKALWKKTVLDIYRKASKAMPEFPRFFSETDALFASELVLRNIADSLSRAPTRLIVGYDEESIRYAIIDVAQDVMEKLGPNFTRYLRSEATLRQILVLRDKAWFLANDLTSQYLPYVFANFLSTLPDEARETYLEIYRETALFYLQKTVFGYITREIEKAAGKAKVPYRDDFSILGRFFTPSGKEVNPPNKSKLTLPAAPIHHSEVQSP